MTADAATRGRTLSPVGSRALWTVGGLTVQAVGLGGVTAFLWTKLRRQDVSGHLTAATFRLVWHGEIHTRTGIAVLMAGAVVYAVGSVLLARPYVSRPATLFIAVPVAAVIGMMVLGALALIVAGLASLADWFTPTVGPRRHRRRFLIWRW